MKKRLWGLVLLLPVMLIGGCSSSTLDFMPISPDISKGEPDRGLEIARETIDELTVSWLTGSQLAITSIGSSSCPLVVVGVSEEVPGQIVLREALTEKICSADLALTTSIFPAPSGWKLATPLEVEYSDDQAIINLQSRE